jgi:hypothetical protein
LAISACIDAKSLHSRIADEGRDTRIVKYVLRALATPLIIILFVTLLFTFGRGLMGFSEWEWHQKLVLEVVTPRAVVSGGSVVKVKVGSTPDWMPFEGGGGMGGKVEGEASFVEVAPGRYLFALLSGGNEGRLAYSAFFPDPGMDNAERNDWLQDFKGSAAVSRSNDPRLVTFTDISDPTTVRRVDPDNLAATFGPGYRLRSVTLEITDEPVTEGEVERVLPWLGEYPEPPLVRSEDIFHPTHFGSSIKHGDFIRR